ncbi:hypothetical protein [Mycoplasma bradburyae]|uniref:Uncharacterized protein n=1 Tax=Mycoplasma bradburyae TaxID=2963128 RepID=A0ABT5GAL2_9MOLU|nr:hypothetical protein [Mycoplasma bradburyae]MDC4181853.1 hypothetical protein [Mycoplasma bradburyae]UTS70152.1 hypothetical protein NMG68_00115 [Mycoplasma bradburyae]
MDRAKFLKISSFIAYATIILSLCAVLTTYIIILGPIKIISNNPEYSKDRTYASSNLHIITFVQNYIGTLVISLFFLIYNLIYLRKNKNTWLASLFPFCFKDLKTSTTFAYKMKPGSYWTLYTFIILSILPISGFQLFLNLVADVNKYIVLTPISYAFLIITCWSVISFIIIVTSSDYKTARLNSLSVSKFEMNTDSSINASINK